MNERQVAKGIVDSLGGEDNIKEVVNCMTRVRIRLNDKSKSDLEKLKSQEGVLGVVDADQIQIVMGPGISERVAKEIANISKVSLKEETRAEMASRRAKENKEKVKEGQNESKFINFAGTIASVFVPLIPAFVGAGLIGGIASIFQNMITAGTVTSPNVITWVQILNIIKNGVYGYLNIFIGINAAKVFVGNQGLGGAIGAIVYLAGMNPENPINNIFISKPLSPGQGGVIGVLISVWLMCQIEGWLHKKVADSLDIIVVPTITLLITGLLSIFVVMPVAGVISNGLIGFINWVINVGGPISGFIMGAIFLPMVMLGLHQILTPIHVSMIEKDGATYLLPILAMAGAGQVGAALAVLVKCRKNKKLVEIAKGGLPVGILGIGEPLIYALTLPMGKTFVTACLGGGVGGAVIGAIGQIGATAIGASGIAMIPLIANGRAWGYCIGLLASYIGGFVLTYLFGIDEKYVNGDGLENSQQIKFK